MSFLLNLQSLIIIILAVSFIYAFVTNKIYIPKIGYFDEMKIGYFLSESKARMIGSATYNEFFNVSSNKEFIYKIPLKVMYFLFSPFPWDVKKLAHIIGMFDGFLYRFVVYLILKNLKTMLKDPFLRIIFIILICYIFMFVIGVSNFGSGLRL